VPCTEIQILMVQATQDELTPTEAARLHRHLAECPRCRETFGELRQVWQILDAWTVPEPPRHLAEAFSSRLAEISARPPRRASLASWLERSSHRWSWLRLRWNLGGLAVAASLALGAIYLFHDRPTPPRPTRQRETLPLMSAVPPDPIAPDGVWVDPSLVSQAPEGQVHFAVHNFSTDIPEINTKHYNTGPSLYEDPF